VAPDHQPLTPRQDDLQRKAKTRHCYIHKVGTTAGRANMIEVPAEATEVVGGNIDGKDCL
jgi:hypothetical protein